MSYASNILTSIFGRRIGLQAMTTNVSGGSRGTQEYLVGPEALRFNHSTAETTSTNLQPFGHSVLTTASSSGVYTLDPPVPGVEKTITFYTTSADPIYLKMASGVQVGSSQMTTATVITSSQTILATLRLVAVSTAQWMAVGSVSSAFLKMTTTT